jgi:LmbE family N-acetylglucosaminyl deacetylase
MTRERIPNAEACQGARVHADPSGPILVLSPHYDDAVLSAWSVLRGPGDVTVVNVCTGTPAPGRLGRWDRVTGGAGVGEDGREFVRLRAAEDSAALALAGREAVGLGLLDAQYRDQPLDPADLGARIEQAFPGASALHAPAGLGLHADHLVVRDVAVALARAVDLPLWLYADQPYAVRMGWPHWVTGAEPRPHLRPEARWAEHLPALDLEPQAVRLTQEETVRKRRALEAYRTQIDALDAGPLGRLRHPEILGWEVRWRALLT